MLGTFHSLWTFEVIDTSNWNPKARSALQILQKQSGFISANIFHSADEPQRYVIQVDWQDVGSYRRAMGSMDSKIGVWPFLADMKDEITAFEKLLTMTPDSILEFDSSVNDQI
jgi:hypothetical protein